MFSLILPVFSFVLLVIAGFMQPPALSTEWILPRRLLCFGLALWVLAEILTHGTPLLKL